ncbi:hypothetical protein CHS0354_040437 [Potamilus streckersoni]|uniref:Uncharacterized protein n=1 Tax=Potamilus streckersoni TaxID=2493646 RepID=A0AAE0W404_9BIVA|nr:hypothetical protein CHS0354_040437 [Potamilus streckersoni]
MCHKVVVVVAKLQIEPCTDGTIMAHVCVNKLWVEQANIIDLTVKLSKLYFKRISQIFLTKEK